MGLVNRLRGYINQPLRQEPPPTGEDAQERAARELVELLQEIRVVLPGVQVLFAFLLTVPFAQRFKELTSLEQYVYYATLLSAALAAALLMSPSAHHRLLWRRGVRERRLAVGNMLSMAGLLFLVPGRTRVIFIITDLLFESGIVSLLVTGLITSVFAFLWFALPILYGGHK